MRKHRKSGAQGLHPYTIEAMNRERRVIAQIELYRDGYLPPPDGRGAHAERDCRHPAHYGPIGETGLEYGITPADHGPHELEPWREQKLAFHKWRLERLGGSQAPRPPVDLYAEHLGIDLQPAPAPVAEVNVRPEWRCAECGCGLEERADTNLPLSWPRCGRQECEDAFHARRAS